MAISTFAAIDIGSFELEMKIFEISKARGIRQIDDIRRRLDLGSDTYARDRVSYERVEDLCQVLLEFKEVMKVYHVDAYVAYGTSAIRESRNTMILLDQIKQRTGIDIGVLSNSEQRFMDYKSIASRTAEFNQMLERGTAILDIGGGSIQLSLFDKGKLITTQNMRLGVLRLQERLNHMNVASSKLEDVIQEMVASQLAVFKKMFLKDMEIRNLIIVDDYLSEIMQKKPFYDEQQGFLSAEGFQNYMSSIHDMPYLEIARKMDIPTENARLLLISSIMVGRVIKIMDIDQLWAPGVTLCDGIAYAYAEQNKLLKVEHDFEADIISSAEHISKRYMGSKKRGETLERISLNIFDSMKKVHGLGNRERLLLRIATLLHDCGKYISMVNLGECSYNIIMSTEIIGISHREREIIANVVKFNHEPFEYYESISAHAAISREDYLVIAKLTAILRVANGLDKSHKQKFKDTKITRKGGTMIIQISTSDDITLEKGLFAQSAEFFEEVYSVIPVIEQKRYF